MDFFLVGLGLWIMIGSALLLFIWGLWKKSWRALVWSGIALLPSILSIYIGGTEGWLKVSILLPLVLFVRAYYMKKRRARLL
ncbi:MULTISPECIES: hypothetical protein [Bacillaceae]|uniref:Uncharacterized protein n=1 Tax=Domibacillus aminovorans TaxID=29332 RepID=A0A177L0J9_9BACI|nr:MULTISPECIES: hypothetical protein [Bacillaceae]OAH54307.1 hypothetical protein AWH48_06790 [Domibacillus aminovorans]OAH58775.1 hypothetical protein AWH49_03615 [Domibacillus aminovorans]